MPGRPFSVNRPAPARNAAITLGVVAIHAAALWGLQRGMQRVEPPTVVPVEILSELVEAPKPLAPAPAPAPVPSPPPPAPAPVPAPPPKPMPQPAKRVSPPRPQPVREPAPAPSPMSAAPAEPSQVATPPAPVAPPTPPAPPAPPPQPSSAPAAPAVQLPSTDADYLRNPPMSYPAMSRRLGEQGTTVLRVLISADGRPLRASLQRSSGFDRLDEAARAGVLTWRFVPGKRNGVAEDMEYNVPIKWQLTN